MDGGVVGVTTNAINCHESFFYLICQRTSCLRFAGCSFVARGTYSCVWLIDIRFYQWSARKKAVVINSHWIAALTLVWSMWRRLKRLPVPMQACRTSNSPAVCGHTVRLQKSYLHRSRIDLWWKTADWREKHGNVIGLAVVVIPVSPNFLRQAIKHRTSANKQLKLIELKAFANLCQGLLLLRSGIRLLANGIGLLMPLGNNKVV